jgi:putative transposase
MQLVEQHVINRTDPRYGVIDAAAFASKNLYNAANYEIRQAYIFERRYLSYNELDKRMQQHEAYRALPAKVAQQVLRQLDQCWQGFFAARKAYKQNPSKFLGVPKLPKYKDKTKGRNVLIYTEQAISKIGLKRGLVCPSMLPIEVKTKQTSIDQVRIVPRQGYYVVEVIYERKVQQADVKSDLCAGVDLGITNLATIASNKPGFIPRLVNGRPLKAMNQWYNKRKAQLQKKLGKTGTTHQIEQLTNKRNRRIHHALHTASKRIIDLLVQEGIGTLIIGKNDGWKQEVEMGTRNNQNFVQIPHARFIDMLTYKAELVGIQVITIEESYTSKASFLDLDPLPKNGRKHAQAPKFSGKRIKRGLYQAADRRIINADVNGAYNIIRKGKPDAFMAKGIAGLVVHPVRIARTKQTKNVVLRKRQIFWNYLFSVIKEKGLLLACLIQAWNRPNRPRQPGARQRKRVHSKSWKRRMFLLWPRLPFLLRSRQFPRPRTNAQIARRRSNISRREALALPSTQTRLRSNRS